MPFGNLLYTSDEAQSRRPTWHIQVLGNWAASSVGTFGILLNFIPKDHPELAVEFGFRAQWDVPGGVGDYVANSSETFNTSLGSANLYEQRVRPDTEGVFLSFDFDITPQEVLNNYWADLQLYPSGSLEDGTIAMGFQYQSPPGLVTDPLSTLGPGTIEIYDIGDGGIATLSGASITFDESAPPSAFWAGYVLCTESDTP